MNAFSRNRPDMSEASAATSQEPNSHGSVILPLGEHPTINLEFGQGGQRSSGAAIVSLLSHVAFIALILLGIRAVPAGQSDEVKPPPPNYELVFLAEPGPGGGGGGGGNRSPDPPRQAELPGKDRMTVPVAPKVNVTPPKEEPPKDVEPPPVPQMNIPVQSLASGEVAVAGVIDRTAVPSGTSQGSGSGGGAGRPPASRHRCLCRDATTNTRRLDAGGRDSGRLSESNSPRGRVPRASAARPGPRCDGIRRRPSGATADTPTGIGGEVRRQYGATRRAGPRGA